MTIYVAIDADTTYALPDGVIVAMNRTNARLDEGLRDKGLDPTDYTIANRRRIEVDETTQAFNRRVQPGWVWHSGAMKTRFPQTDLEIFKTSMRQLWQQISAWELGLDESAHGQPLHKVQVGHTYIFRGRGGAYLIARDTSRTLAVRTAWANAMRLGAADIDSVLAFYRHFAGSAVAHWITYVNPDTATRLDLEDSIEVMGTIPDSVDLTSDSWIEDIAS